MVTTRARILRPAELGAMCGDTLRCVCACHLSNARREKVGKQEAFGCSAGTHSMSKSVATKLAREQTELETGCDRWVEKNLDDRVPTYDSMLVRQRSFCSA